MTVHTVPLCSHCSRPNDRPSQRYCRNCHNTYMRAWRQDTALTTDHRQRDISRSYAAVYKTRGKLAPLPCQCCGSPDSEMHHHELPLLVIWLCPPCHRAWHSFWREAAVETFDQWLELARRRVGVRSFHRLRSPSSPSPTESQIVEASS